MSRNQARQLAFDPARLIVARLAAGLTQEMLARQLGVGLRTVTRWEGGESEPAAVKLLRLSEILDVEPDDLYVRSVAA